MLLENSLAAKCLRALAAGPGLQCTLEFKAGPPQAIDSIGWKSVVRQFRTNVFA